MLQPSYYLKKKFRRHRGGGKKPRKYAPRKYNPAKALHTNRPIGNFLGKILTMALPLGRIAGAGLNIAKMGARYGARPLIQKLGENVM